MAQNAQGPFEGGIRMSGYIARHKELLARLFRSQKFFDLELPASTGGKLKRKLNLNLPVPICGRMKRLRVLNLAGAHLLLAGLILCGGCEKKVESAPQLTGAIGISEPTEAQPKLPTVKLWLGSEQMDAEMCATPRQTQTGMMFRKSMGENDGMIFNLGYDQQASFWMKNCFVPLSVAYISADGVIEEIHPLQPQDETPVAAGTNNIHFALETPQGWFEKHHVTTGMVVRSEKGSLMETFGQRQ